LKKEGVDVENFLVDQTEPAAAAGAMSGGAIVKIEDGEEKEWKENICIVLFYLMCVYLNFRGNE